MTFLRTYKIKNDFKSINQFYRENLICILIQATVKKNTLLLICFRWENGIVVKEMYAGDMTEYQGLLQNNPIMGSAGRGNIRWNKNGHEVITAKPGDQFFGAQLSL